MTSLGKGPDNEFLDIVLQGPLSYYDEVIICENFVHSETHFDQITHTVKRFGNDNHQQHIIT